jgi:hydroxyethylthiazole kinase-like uncharacterized protein yjeF
MSTRIPAISPKPITQSQVMANFPKRPRDSHKGLFGTVAVIGGANGMIGAPLMAARAALKLGAGCVHVGMLAENAPVVDAVQPELMLHSAKAALQLPDVDVFAIGCGLGTSIAAQKLLYDALMRDTALVIDADALNLLARHADLQDDLHIRQTASVLTPHPGEAARLLGCDIKEIQADRVAAVRKLAQKFTCSVVLKGADSLCATRDGRLFVNTTGNPGMSSAGMGDVLTGMIAAFIAQGLTADNAMLLAVHLHGAAGDALAQQQATIGMTATEVTEWARWLLNRWASKS